ncbi:MAG TPA: vitamin B12-dependent ribonucleotide reductase [Polyangia bacterium]|jgi:ribonucleoside-diphosphate reductase alpha chain|nr:vitamin B12-dependent ribonucleotide reductase [Polyangia bacterium]
MLEKHDVRRNRNGRAGGASPAPFTAPSRRAGKPDASGKAATQSTPARGLKLRRYFTAAGDDGFAGVEWELRTAAITGENGKSVFEQRDVEVPKSWSQTATNVVVQKYFRGTVGTPERERSVRQLISRVADTITGWGRHGRDGKSASYFADAESAAVFNAELKHLLVSQKMAFNSPVWFNVGSEAEPQCSACFINSVDDTMESILGLAKTEGMLFKYGSGTGTNLSPIRSSKELLNGGGTASGPVSFMRGFDAFAGVIKSGGKTRRAAKMVMLDIDHPDIEEFIWCKGKEEKKAWTLIDAGYDGSFDGEAYKSIFFQNSNNSVRVTDDFMEAVEKDRDWTTRAVRDGSPVETVKARKLWRDIAEAAWMCGDPGLQYDTTINDWHTSSGTARINASNPCSEYMYLDDSACNLASLNLRKFVAANVMEGGGGTTTAGEFDVNSFRRAVETTILAQEIIVGNAKYPTPKIAENSLRFRPLGLGYANLGALLMSRGLPYDSAPARAYAGTITALMTGWAYRTSAVIARDVTGPFDGYAENREPFIGVMKKHRKEVDKLDAKAVPADMLEAARDAWDQTIAIGKEHGYRNGQATVLAPTGTIGFMMDCDTTGIEPDIALIKYKRLVGGGMIKIVNNTITEALAQLGYDDTQVKAIVEYIDTEETIEGAPGLKPEHLPVFDCAFRAANGTRSIHYQGHIRMMAAAQPFISGAISKTVNLPPEATVEDVQEAYMESWKQGLKAVAIYRDGCKRTQPLSTSKTDPGLVKGGHGAVAAEPIKNGPPAAVRRKLGAERQSFTHKFAVAGHEGYIHVGLYETGEPGEIFVKMAKEGSTISGLMDSFATAISLALQHGVPLRLLCDKFARTRFEPYGFTENPEIPRASSIMDYLFRWLAAKFVRETPGAEAEPAPTATAADREIQRVGEVVAAAQKVEVIDVSGQNGKTNGHTNGHKNGDSTHTGNGNYSFIARTDAPTCPECGSIMIPNGSCHKCVNCGTTSGCS